MASETLDRRVRKTRQQLRRCLSILLKEKKIQDISVRELTEMADLNRGTFYLHYKDVFDLLEKIELELLEELNMALAKHQKDELREKPSRLFIDVFQCVQNNADMVQILLGENGDLNFSNRVRSVVREKCLEDWMATFHDKKSTLFDAYYSFIVSGCIGLVMYWLQNDLRESPQEMAEIAEQIIRNGMLILD